MSVTEQRERASEFPTTRDEIESLRQQLASRDAEVAELKKEVADHHFSWAGCSQQLKDVCKDLEEVEQERDQLREESTNLRTQLYDEREVNGNYVRRLKEISSEHLSQERAKNDKLREQVTDLQGQVGLLLRIAKALAATEPK